MTDQRRFTHSQRGALYLLADGLCEECGDPLDQGFHADHKTPWSKGGVTDLINGQALCPPCNLKKGSKLISPRLWQERARLKWFTSSPSDFTVSATPGAGKTWYALSLAREQLDLGSVNWIVVVVPTDSLREQWADNAVDLGLHLKPVGGIEDYDKRGYNGCVVTYAQAARGVGSEALRRLTGRREVFAILDEIHHAGENRSWGEGLAFGLERAKHRLALTGTPWRRDNNPIPFVRYDGDKVHLDYAYEYGAAVSDGVCRRIEFMSYDGEGKWMDRTGVESSAKLGADLRDDDVAAVLESVLDPSFPWIRGVLAEADRDLEELRQQVPDAGGLVIAQDMLRARRYAQILTDITGVEPTTVLSDDPTAKGEIDRFRGGRQKWIVAVRMVSEGVDIPRLLLGVYASHIRTPLFFRQVIGRLVRVRSQDEPNARLYLPGVPALLQHAVDIEEELRHQLELDIEVAEKETVDRIVDSDEERPRRQPLSASEPTFQVAILSGEGISPDEYAAGQAFCRANGIPESFATNIARGFRANGQPPSAPAIAVSPDRETPRHRAEQQIRKDIERLVNDICRREGVEHKEVNTDILKAGFPARKQADLEQLEATRDHLIARRSRPLVEDRA